MSVLRRNNVTERGIAGPVMLFGHGFGCSQTVWTEVADAFASTHRQVLFDYVGSGKSELSAFDAVRYSELDAYVQDLLDVCDELQLDSGITLVAHSVSCTIGLLASLRRPGLFGRMIMLGPSPCFINHLPEYRGGFEREDLTGLLELMEQNYMGWAEYLAPVAAGAPGRVASDLVDRFCSTDPLAAKAFAFATFFSDQRAVLPLVPTRCLILQHRHDVLAPLEVGDYLHHHIKGSTLRILEARGHCGHLTCPDLVIEEMRAYLGDGHSSMASCAD